MPDVKERVLATLRERLMQPRRAGRPTKMTPSRVERFLDALVAGAPETLACRYAGWTYSVYRTWIIRGESAKGHRVYRDFLDARDVSLAEGEMALVAQVRDAANRDWRAALELLKRRYPDSYGDRSRVDIGGPGGGAILLSVHPIQPAEVKKNADGTDATPEPEPQ